MAASHKSKYILLCLILLNFLIIFATGFMMPVWSEFVKNIHGDLRTAGNAICLFSIILGVFTWIAAKIENKLHCNKLIVFLSQGMFVLSYAGYFFVHDPWQLYIVQILLGLSGAIQAPALFALYESFIPSQQSTFYWGIWAGSYNVAIGVGSIISAYTVHHFGFNIMFVTLLASAIVCFLLTAIVMYQAELIEKQNDKA